MTPLASTVINKLLQTAHSVLDTTFSKLSGAKIVKSVRYVPRNRCYWACTPHEQTHFLSPTNHANRYGGVINDGAQKATHSARPTHLVTPTRKRDWVRGSTRWLTPAVTQKPIRESRRAPSLFCQGQTAQHIIYISDVGLKPVRIFMFRRACWMIPCSCFVQTKTQPNRNSKYPNS